MGILGWIALAVLAAAAVYAILSVVLAAVAAYRYPHVIQKAASVPWKQYMEAVRREKDWFCTKKPEQVEILSLDGLKLRGRYLPFKDSDSAILLMHGYRAQSGEDDFSSMLRFYWELGLSVLVVDQRAHGSSEGKAICFGVKERLDCKQWAQWLEERAKPANLYLAGLSMGAATVLMATELPLPQSLRGVIADCGYTSPCAICAHVLKTSYHMPAWPFVPMANGVLRLMAHCDLRNCSALEAMRKDTSIPVLFIHGEQDCFVPMAMGRENYEACQAEKELLIVPSAAHALSVWEDEARVKEKIAAFIYKHKSAL
ncbi:MAG: alpha/beta hydrolase [Clostridia bacterium]